jgi:hypothetical protein
VLDRVRGLPGVRAAALRARCRSVAAADAASASRSATGNRARAWARHQRRVEGVFRDNANPLKAGRTFDSRDVSGGARTVVVNDLMAARFFRGDAVGKSSATPRIGSSKSSASCSRTSIWPFRNQRSRSCSTRSIRSINRE